MIRIQRFIRETGYCSRREAERLIAAERVRINEETANKNSFVTQGDVVLIDRKEIKQNEDPAIYIALNKPVGITCTAAEHIKGNIIEFVNHPYRVFPVGRLDKASEGLILLTNDGDIVNKILRAEHHHEKEYVVTVDKPFSDAFLEGMSKGVQLPNVKTNPCRVFRVNDVTFRIILTQGLNRQIRRMCRAFGYTVTKLERIRIMNVKLGGLEKGKWRDLTAEELKTLHMQVENS
ncbi:23S rRNA pseudouridine2604 synthase [Bacillus iocasae]|uniref:Pseudouridine synthase n=1 Tax=Priestia iocasae TaxID=2291674 RepID=A0ABS2QRL2_9BACI|nr:pseudouridine synthase [Metabacillus iocasae]MBM7702081.1 23S rRNA pseudouridine2604 synthase [Metabacillus iocasae]